MFMILSGEIGAGKSTVCREVVRFLTDRGVSCGGVMCEKTVRGEIIVADASCGERMLLGSPGGAGSLLVGKYAFDPAAMDFAVSAVERGRQASVLVVDELGPLELAGGGLSAAIDLIRTGEGAHCLAVIRQELVPAFMPLLDRPARIFRVNAENRTYLPRQIGALFANACAASVPVLSR